MRWPMMLSVIMSDIMFNRLAKQRKSQSSVAPTHCIHLWKIQHIPGHS